MDRTLQESIGAGGRLPGGRMNARITRDNINSLRTVVRHEEPARQAFERFFFDLKSIALGLFATNPKKTNSMCRYYGHVIDRSSWKGSQSPKCYDCGGVVTSPDQLRKASPIESKMSEQPTK